MPTDVSELKEVVALGCRVLGAEGHSDLTLGHISGRDPDGRGVWLKGSGFGLDESVSENVVLVNERGEVIEGTGNRHAEYPIHTEIMKARADVGGVVHTHPLHAVVFGSLGVPLRPVSHDGSVFTPPDVPRFTQTSDLIVTPELGKAVTATLGDLNALLLVNHGIVVVGPDVKSAVIRAVLLERACRAQLLAMSAGPPQLWSNDEDALAKRQSYLVPNLHRHWDYLVRLHRL